MNLCTVYASPLVGLGVDPAGQHLLVLHPPSHGLRLVLRHLRLLLVDFVDGLIIVALVFPVEFLGGALLLLCRLLALVVIVDQA